jgi:hypothetical protein
LYDSGPGHLHYWWYRMKYGDWPIPLIYHRELVD